MVARGSSGSDTGGLRGGDTVGWLERSEDLGWLDEIDLDPDGSWLRMGTRALGDRPWLVVDSNRDAELALKAELLAARHGEVFAAEPGTEAPSQLVLDLVTAELAAGESGAAGTGSGRADQPAASGLGDAEPGAAGGAETAELAAGDPGADAVEDRHPLDAAGRLVQEDLCLLRRAAEGWLLVAGSLCFPSRWRLREKLGRPLDVVHGPVAGYDTELASRVDRLLDRLDDRIVWRRNWFIHPDGALFQPDRPADGDPVIPADRCLNELYLRSERQTLRRLDGRHVLFTIRIQQCRLAALVVEPARRRALAAFVDDAPDAISEHRGIGRAQRPLLVTALAD